jgi:hypothetical protein
MTLGSAADVPMGEFWLHGFNTAHAVVEAAGIAHTGGKTVVAAESFTSDDTEAWRAHPASMKALGDWAFAAGVNRIVFHRYQHQAGLALRPGLTMGPYGVHWERTQTWWDMAPAYHEYLARCQYLLRRGAPVADILFLVAEGAPHAFRPPDSALRGDPPGPASYAFDGCPPETLMASAAVENGRVVFPGGASYAVLVLPERETMTPAFLAKVRDLVAAGATVVGPRPRKSPSLSGFPACDAEVARLAGELWGDCDGEKVTEHAFGRGRVVWVTERRSAESASRQAPAPDVAPSASRATWQVGAPPLDEPRQYGDFTVVADALRQMGLVPDFASEPSLRWTHRRDGGSEIYFVANPEDRVVEATARFRVAGLRPELWDPLTGRSRKLVGSVEADGITAVGLRLEPFQSFFVVFREGIPAVATTSSASPGGDFPAASEIEVLGGAWDVAFDPRWGGPQKIVFAALDDWSLRPEPGIRYYSGTAVYRKTFDISSSTPAGDVRLWLDLGAVKNIAAVRLNGRDLGVVWCDPWRVEITEAIRRKGNRLEVRVANLWPNRLIGDEREPPDAEYAPGGNLVRWPEWLLEGRSRRSPGRRTFSTWKHFAADSPLLPSGLLGPVKILQAPGR